MQRRRCLLLGLAAGLLAPSVLVAQIIAEEVSRNDLVRDALRREGDDGDQPRVVDHFVYPVSGGNPAPRHRVTRALEGLGMSVRAAATNSGLIGSHVTMVSGDEFDIFTSDLRRLMEALGWVYDGWETFVVRAGGS